MSVVYYFFKTVWRMKRLAVVYTILFLALAVANSSQSSKQTTVFEDSRLDIRVVNESTDDSVANGLIDYLKEHHDVHLVSTSELTLKEQLFSGETDGVILIPEHLTQDLQQGKVTTDVLVGKSSSSQLLYQSVASYLRFSRALLVSGEYTSEKMNEVMAQQAEVSVIDMPKSETSNWGQEYFAFTPFLYVSIFVGLFGMIFSSMMGQNVLHRMQLAKKSITRIAMEQFLGGLFTVIGFVAFYTIAALVIQPSLLSDSQLVKYVILSGACALTSYALAFLFVMIIGENQFLYSAMSLLCGLGLSFISGVFVPVELLSKQVLMIARLFPVYYTVEGIDRNGTSFADYGVNVAIVLAFGLLYLVIALAMNRVKKNSSEQKLKLRIR